MYIAREIALIKPERGRREAAHPPFAGAQRGASNTPGPRPWTESSQDEALPRGALNGVPHLSGSPTSDRAMVVHHDDSGVRLDYIKHRVLLTGSAPQPKSSHAPFT